MDSVIHKEDVTDEVAAAAERLLQSPLSGSAKSVRFSKDIVADESAEILARSRSQLKKMGTKDTPVEGTRGAAGKPKRSILVSPLKSRTRTRQKATPPDDVDPQELLDTRKQDEADAARERRQSLRHKSDVSTYNARENARASAGLVPSVSRTRAARAVSTESAPKSATKALEETSSASKSPAKRKAPPRESSAREEAKESPSKKHKSQREGTKYSHIVLLHLTLLLDPSSRAKRPQTRTSRENEQASSNRTHDEPKDDAEIDEAGSDVPPTEQIAPKRKRGRPRKVEQNKPTKIPPSTLQQATHQGVFGDSNDAEVNASEEEEEEDEAGVIGEEDSLFIRPTADLNSMFGLMPDIEKIVEAVIKHRERVHYLWGTEYRRKKQLGPIGEFDTLRQKLRKAYKTLANATIKSEDTSPPIHEIDENLLLMVDMVRDLDPDKEDVLKIKLATQIYAYVFPDLARIFTGAVNCHKTVMEHQGTPDTEPNLAELAELVLIAKCIVDLGDKAREWKTKVDSELSLVKPVRNEIVAPLKTLLKKFQKHQSRIEKKQESERTSRSQNEHRQREEEQQALRAKEDEIFERKVDRLRLLYAARQYAESNPKKKTSKKFHMPDVRSKHQQRYPLDSDANGETFERVPVFVQRPVGSHVPDAEGEVADDDWSFDELVALEHALRNCHGKFLRKT
jgi:hypothetical protein